MKRPTLFPPISALAFGITIASFFLYFLLQGEEERVRGRLAVKGERLKDAIEREFLKSESVLRSIEGFFHSSEFVTREEFQVFCENSIAPEFPLHFIEWQPKVLESERADYERRAKESGLKNFQFYELDEKGNEIPAKKRPYHFPVYYSYSPDSEIQANGLDLAFSPLRMRSKYKSMRLGKPVLSRTFDVILKTNKKTGFGFSITYPVFNEAAISSSEKIKHLKGFISIVLYLNEFFNPLAKESEFSTFQFQISDMETENEIIYSTIRDEQVDSRFSLSTILNVGSRRWSLSLRPTKSYIEKETSFLPWIIWSLLIALTIAFSSYLYFKSYNQMKIHRFERQLQQKQKLESLGVLASGIAHEFNNILHCIILANENIKLSKTDESKERSLKTSLDYCERGKNLVRQILSFARQDTGQYKEILPSREIKDTLELMQSSLSRNITFVSHIEEEGDFPLFMNGNHISQILMNLVNNAAHAMNDEGVIQITYSVNPNERHLIVSDQGHGMSEDVREKIFDPFFTTKPVNEGTGLGLSVIYGIVKRYDGHIEVLSEPGKGTTFKVILPG